MPLRQSLASALIVLALAAPSVAAQDPIRTERVQFAPGAESATVEGRITGDEVIDYLVNVRAGQAANISLGARSGAAFFNLIPPGGAQWEAIFVGARQGRQFEGVLDRGGDWRVRVYQMGNAADAGETHAFRLEIIVAAGQAAAPGHALQVACAEAARDLFRDWEAGVDLRSDEPRVDGTRTVHGEIYLETRAASVMCAFTPDGERMIEFFVDGEDRTGFVTGGGTSRPSTDVSYAAPEEGGPRRWQVTARGGLRMHREPSVTSPTVETLPEGAILSNLGCEAGPDRVWCDVQPFRGGARGWVAAEFLAPAPGAEGSAAPTGPDDSALRAGRGEFDATAPDIPCTRGGGPLRDVCQLGVARGGGGDATVVITFPDGVRRALFFTHGEFVSADASEAGGGFDTEWSKDASGTYRIRVDDERFAIPEAVVFGG